jgi:hypothetical protein
MPGDPGRMITLHRAIPSPEIICSRFPLMKNAQLVVYFNLLCGDPAKCSLENRIFNSVMLLTSLVGGLITISNIILCNNGWLIACSAVSAFLTSLAYGYSRKTKKYELLVAPVVVYFLAIMTVSWLVNDGTKGAGSYFFFLLMTIGILLIKRPFPMFAVAIVVTLVALLMVEFFYPSFLIGYNKSTQRFFDVGISLIVCLVFNGAIIHVVFQEYLRERRLKDALLAQTLKDKEDLEQAHSEIRVLRGCLPICANCKKIRDKNGKWNQIEEYLSEYSEAKLTHGICPECVEQLYPFMQNKDLSPDAVGR